MHKHVLEIDAKELSTREIAKKHSLSQTTIRYWLKKHSISISKPQITNCTICGKDTIGERHRTRCGSCITSIRRYLTKKAGIALLGGACRKCGWNKDITGLDFHHKKDKSFSLSRANNKSWEVVRKELEKCELLCANCHRMEHSGYNSKIIEAAKNYKGKLSVG